MWTLILDPDPSQRWQAEAHEPPQVGDEAIVEGVSHVITYIDAEVRAVFIAPCR